MSVNKELSHYVYSWALCVGSVCSNTKAISGYVGSIDLNARFLCVGRIFNGFYVLVGALTHKVWVCVCVCVGGVNVVKWLILVPSK